MTLRRLSYSSSGRRPCNLCITRAQVPPCPSTVETQSCGSRRSLVVTPRYTLAYVRHTLGDSVTQFVPSHVPSQFVPSQAPSQSVPSQAPSQYQPSQHASSQYMLSQHVPSQYVLSWHMPFQHLDVSANHLPWGYTYPALLPFPIPQQVMTRPSGQVPPSTRPRCTSWKASHTCGGKSHEKGGRRRSSCGTNWGSPPWKALSEPMD